MGERYYDLAPAPRRREEPPARRGEPPRPRRRGKKRRRRDPLRSFLGLLLLAALAAGGLAAANHVGAFSAPSVPTALGVRSGAPRDPYYTPSAVDYDSDGLEDYADMVAGIREYFATQPVYVSKYYAGGYPDQGEGVCTDVIWKGFQAAGYDLKQLVDADIAAHREDYTCIETVDSNIDFRHVDVLHRFFARHATELSCDLTDPSLWQAGDIVIFDDDQHIGVCGDTRNENGIPILLHHGGKDSPYPREADDIYNAPVTAHYRWPG